ncbi:putative flagellar hook-associated protein 1 [Selenomonas ruminantium subsp. lactilytica TAM6421]|uniref:Flagellar hook-associated protein 1 n=1 Tax=Selenomonas ruminantium subsp. lactilytica (strain NBRC 103574 / TAM6421) TaxID=927704 RepID=I0GTT8_SELRL|nr:flagellar hook-associated protein FlgK [Selenomonas ruminantium]BAL84175.1 putative flagellar hook-associated protein 1 [Selenomonas ruminantium subsp. lactilytica TAM6421]
MRSTFSGLNTMVRGVFANQLSLDTVGHNITNASTEGYSRQSVNQAATRAQEVPSLYGNSLVGTGVDAMSIMRARNVYADKQFWAETSTHEYYKNQQVNYDKLEAIFDDSDKTGILNAMEKFYKAWSDLSANASTNSNRVTVVEQANILIDRVKTVSSQLQDQINAQYEDMRVHLSTINDINGQIVDLNKNIMSAEAAGSHANDLRDQRDLLVDELSKYMNLNVYEDDKGMYTVVSNGISMVNGINKLTLEMSDPYNNTTYGINDYTIQIKESGVSYIPLNGSLKAQLDTIAEDKTYIDKMADMMGFMLTTFNNMHQQGAGIDGADGNFGEFRNDGTYIGPSYGRNFFGDDNTIYSWDNTEHRVVATEYVSDSITRSLDYTDNGNEIYTPVVKIDGTLNEISYLDGINIINAMQVNGKITETGGTTLIAARKLTVEKYVDGNGTYGLDPNTGREHIVKVNGPGDGTNAVNMSNLFNLDASNVTNTATLSVQYVDLSETVRADANAVGKISLNAYYNSAMSTLGTNANSVDIKESAQDDLITQIVSWRSSTSGVDWNEELTNMIMFQKGYSACSRCLTTMDEMLDRLINSTGTVGR